MKHAELKEWIRDKASVSFSRSGGPGGQYVNTADTKVQLRLNLRELPLDEEERERVLRLLAGRINAEGELIVASSETRSQAKNREQAEKRAFMLITGALKKPKKRRPTKPSKAARERRLQAKKARSEKKQQRKDPRL